MKKKIKAQLSLRGVCFYKEKKSQIIIIIIIIIIINKKEMKTFTIDVDDMTSKMDILENN